MLSDKDAIDGIVARIQECELSSPQIEVLATEVLSLRSKEVATSLFKMLIHQPAETITTNLLDLLRELAVRSPEWTRILEKSTKKRGRCPKPLIPRVRQLLATEPDRFATRVDSIRDLLADLERMVDEPVNEQSDHSVLDGVKIEKRTQWFRSGKIRATVPMRTELSDIRHMEALSSMLGEITPEPDELCLDFSGVEHIYMIGLVALKAWCNARNIVPKVINVSNTTEKYLDDIGFTSASERCAFQSTDSDPHYAMAIESIVADSQPETIAGKIVDIVDNHMPLLRKSRSGLIVVFAELIENIQRHSGTKAAAFAGAQVYPKKRRLTICIIDTGIGIRESIMSSSNVPLIRRVEEGESAIGLACAPLITSKPDKHSGYGLYVASELIVRNGGTFRLFSGNEIFTCYRKKWQRKENLASASKDWQGTWIAMIVDLDALLPVEDVYSILPPVPGVQLQDFFEHG